MERTTSCLAKLERMNKALRHEEPDRVPISDFFWGSFVKRWRAELNLPANAEPYSYYDLDWIVTTPNMDPVIRSFETIRENEQEVVIKTGFGAYNPLEVKASMDAVALNKQYGDQIGYCGNNDIQVWETGDRELIKREILKKLNAAKRGGFIFQSDHSVTSAVSGHTYDYIVKLVREYGKYPLQLGLFNIEI